MRKTHEEERVEFTEDCTRVVEGSKCIGDAFLFLIRINTAIYFCTDINGIIYELTFVPEDNEKCNAVAKNLRIVILISYIEKCAMYYECNTCCILYIPLFFRVFFF